MFDADVAADRVTAFLDDQLEKTGADAYVVGVSGGLDSALAIALAVRAVGADDVVGVLLPDDPSIEENVADARELCSDLGVEWREASIAPLVEAARETYPADFDKLTVGNLRARVRMCLLYAEANERGGLVVGPSNKSEYQLGYFTKFGDGAADVRPFADIYKTELYELARHTGLDEKFVEKAPSAELWEGQTDEGELGASYETIDAILKALLEEGRSVAETAAATATPVGEVERFAAMHRESQHKRELPPYPDVPR
ncbi:NAD+ synthase [Salinirarus marinus]|uniref:NAD+ synthase n=1 Tax=Salinirarus marinus TaxID=3068310 RepID=UPI003C6C4207